MESNPLSRQAAAIAHRGQVANVLETIADLLQIAFAQPERSADLS